MGRSAYDTTDKLHAWGPGAKKESRGESRDLGDHSAKQGDPKGITEDRKVIQGDPRNTTVVYKK